MTVSQVFDTPHLFCFFLNIKMELEICPARIYMIIKLHDMTHVHFSGEFCDVEILACESSPCHDNSTVECISTPPLKYTCVCVPGYHGDRCDLDINECDSAPCINGGLCIDSTNRYGEFNLNFMSN